MPTVGGKKFAYDKEGKTRAYAEALRTGKSLGTEGKGKVGEDKMQAMRAKVAAKGQTPKKAGEQGSAHGHEGDDRGTHSHGGGGNKGRIAQLQGKKKRLSAMLARKPS